jgi:hypothetical protein
VGSAETPFRSELAQVACIGFIRAYMRLGTPPTAQRGDGWPPYLLVDRTLC